MPDSLRGKVIVLLHTTNKLNVSNLEEKFLSRKYLDSEFCTEVSLAWEVFLAFVEEKILDDFHVR